MMDSGQISRLAKALNCLRPDWSVAELKVVLSSSSSLLKVTPSAAVLVSVACSLDPHSRSFSRVNESGSWWSFAEDSFEPGYSSVRAVQAPLLKSCRVCGKFTDPEKHDRFWSRSGDLHSFTLEDF